MLKDVNLCRQNQGVYKECDSGPEPYFAEHYERKTIVVKSLL